MESLVQSIFFFVILIFSVVIHEVSHGYAALYLGDRTAQYAGRLTLNPIPHLDMFGSIILPAFLVLLNSPFLIGWAKPVPYNPYNLRNQKWGPAIVGGAGPAANILLAVIFGLAVRFLPFLAEGPGGIFFSNFIAIASIVALLNLVLAIFNLVPIPPLDGSKVLFSLMPYNWYGARAFLEQYGFILLIVFILYFARIISPIVVFLFYIITGTFPFS
jgi:Zn-dependent protease